MPEHHCSGPDLPYGIRNASSGDIRCGTMHRFKHGWELPLRIQVCRWRDAYRADNGRPQVRQNVSKKIGSDYDIKPIRMPHEMGSENIDVVLIGAYVLIFLGQRLKSFMPEGHRVDDPIGFGGGGQVALAGPGQLKSKAHHAIDSAFGENSLLNGHLVGRAFIQSAADIGILAFVIFADNAKVDFSGFPFLKRAFHPFEQSHRPQVYVLPKSAANGNKKAPQGHMIGNARMSHGSKKDCVKGTQLLQPVGGHHLSGTKVGLAAPVERMPIDPKPEKGAGGFNDADSFRHDLLTDTIPGNDRDMEGLHRSQCPCAVSRGNSAAVW